MKTRKFYCKFFLIWQTEEDCLTGKMGEYLFRKLPNSELINIPNAGHLWIMENMKTVLGKLVLNN
jgi:hypothetical protein